MIDVKADLYLKIRTAREALLMKLDGLSDFDVRRPLTTTGTNLLGLVKHNAVSDSRYFGLVFDRPCPEPIPAWDDVSAYGTDFWASEDETRSGIVDLSKRVWVHADDTIEALALDASGFVPWWDEKTVTLFTVMVHRLCNVTRHAGHADVLREGLDGVVGVDENAYLHGLGEEFWSKRREMIESAARSTRT